MNLIARLLAKTLQQLDVREGAAASSREHEVQAEFVAGVDNDGADAPSRGDMPRFWKWAQSAEGEALLGCPLSELTIVDLSSYAMQVRPTLRELNEESVRREDVHRA